MADPVGFLAGMPGRLKDEYTAKWRHFQALRAAPDPRSQFEAGKVAGEVTMELLLLLAGLVAAGATVVKIAGKVPRLLEWARALRAPKRFAMGTGSSTAALESSAARAPTSAHKPEAPAPTVGEAAASAAPVAERLPLGGDVTTTDLALATTEGTAPEQIAARRKVATQFYEQYGKMPPEKSASHIAALDATKPIKVGPPPPLAPDQYQWRIIGRGTGQYFSDPGIEPSKLGILDRGNVAHGSPVYPRIAEHYKMPADAPYLESTSAPVMDDFSIIGEKYPVEGGATQRFVPAASTTPTKVL
ncbi:MAG TPA: polymorphic toxin type 46 domain-containing protein [Polyangiales bacterium]